MTIRNEMDPQPPQPLRLYNVGVSHVAPAGFPQQAFYMVVAPFASRACDHAVEMARSQFPASMVFTISSINPQTLCKNTGDGTMITVESVE